MNNMTAWFPILLAVLFMPSFAFGDPLFQENFDDGNFVARGWYDSPGGTISTSEHHTSGASSFECSFIAGAQECSGGAPGRHKFSPSNSVYFSYWIKHSANWVGSGPTNNSFSHVFSVLTNLDSDYTALTYNHLTAYIEENLGFPTVLLQDGQNIDETRIGQNLVGITENRSVAGCNGTQPLIGQFSVDCYLSGPIHRNYTQWRGPTAYFFDANQKTGWHFVEAYFQLNTVATGTGQPNGVIRYWYDGRPEIDHNNVIIRTGAHPVMQFNQLVLRPNISVGSPVAQTIWIDNLTVATSRPTGTADIPHPPSSMFIIP